jgi:hypothetical protein
MGVGDQAGTGGPHERGQKPPPVSDGKFMNKFFFPLESGGGAKHPIGQKTFSKMAILRYL